MAVKGCASMFFMAALLVCVKGQLKMRTLDVYFSPTGPKAAVNTFCQDYADAIANTTDGDSSQWLALWSTVDPDSLQMIQPAGPGVVTGLTDITSNAPANFEACECVASYPTFSDNAAGFVFQITPNGGSPFQVLDIIEFDVNMKMTKLEVYFNPAGTKPTITTFCQSYADAIARTTDGDSTQWLNLWSTVDPETLQMHQPVGTGVVTGWTNILPIAPQNFSACTCVSAWPTASYPRAGFVFDIFPNDGTAFTVLDIITFEEWTNPFSGVDKGWPTRHVSMLSVVLVLASLNFDYQ